MVSPRIHRWYQCALAALLTPILISSATADPLNVNIRYRVECDAPEQALALGVQNNSIAGNGDTSAAMVGAFTVSQAARSAGIWNCMELRYVQVIRSDACPAGYLGNPRPRAGHSVIDSPSGGWDYMYQNDDPTHRTAVRPEYTDFVDTNPWYYTNSGQFNLSSFDGRRRSVRCESYRIIDTPAYCPDNGVTSFSTWLVAEPLHACTDGPSDCLQPGQFLLLDEWDWSIQRNATTGVVNNTISMPRAPTAADVTILTDALSEGGFTGFEPVIDGIICCPTPGVSTLIVIGLAARCRRRRAA